MRSVDSFNIERQRVILRVDFNVPIDSKGIVEDDTRIKAAKPTLDYLLEHNCKVILISYLGRPEKNDPSFSLKPALKNLAELYPEYEIVFVDDFSKDDSQIINQTGNQIILLENIRFHPEEKNCEVSYVKKIASYGDIFVNDAFSVSHRKEATVTELPQYMPSYAGFLLEREVKMLKKALGGKGKPRVTILGGAKVSTKINLIDAFINSSDYILLGGALANTFLAARGDQMGESLFEKDYLDKARELVKNAEDKGCKMLLPIDFVCDDETMAVLDIGPDTVKQYAEIISRAHTIIWNGPMGYYEDPRYRAGSDLLFSAIAANHTALSIIGGGDTLLILENKSEEEKSHISHISTGGGAMLEFIENGTLPGIEAILDAQQHESAQ